MGVALQPSPKYAVERTRIYFVYDHSYDVNVHLTISYILLGFVCFYNFLASLQLYVVSNCLSDVDIYWITRHYICITPFCVVLFTFSGVRWSLYEDRHLFD